MKALLLITLAVGILVSGCQSTRREKAQSPQQEFAQIYSGQTVEKLAGGMRFLEGPQWIPNREGFLVFSDIPANELKRWDPQGGLQTFRKPSGSANGNTLDRDNNLVSAEHGNRRLSLTHKDQTIETLVDTYKGKKLNSPNDVVVKRDGTLWFTDPDYGLAGRTKEQAGNYVYRYNPKTKDILVVATDFDKPNGLAFSPDERTLYVADSGKPHHIRSFGVLRDNTLSPGKVFCVIDKGGPDGIRVDAQGRVWSSAADGVHIFRQDGLLLGKIPVPESPANLCFGDRDMQTLYITARTSLYRVKVGAKGMR